MSPISLPTTPVALAPLAYRTKPGPNVLRWMKARGWIDRRVVVRLARETDGRVHSDPWLRDTVVVRLAREVGK